MVPFRLDQTAFNDQTPPVRTMADFFLGTSLVNSAAPTIGAAALEQKMGRDHHFSVGLQQQVAPFTVVELNYVGNIGSFLNGTTNINIPEPGSARYPRWWGTLMETPPARAISQSRFHSDWQASVTATSDVEQAVCSVMLGPVRLSL